VRITLLGTGDTIGTPKIGCQCDRCCIASHEGRQRLRTSLLVENEGHNIGSPKIDAVLWTHGHYDHFSGYNEFYRIQHMPPAYAPPEVIASIADHLHFLKIPRHPRPAFEPFTLYGLTFTFVEVNHPSIYACGVVIEKGGSKIVHTGDTNRHIPEKSLEMMQDPDLLFVDAIVPAGIEIGKHMNYAEAVDLAIFLGARDFRCVHMSHLLPWNTPHAGEDGEVFRF
jgi:phosphoribosyl 1,2-cyclic phosphate phosphodiesterase